MALGSGTGKGRHAHTHTCAIHVVPSCPLHSIQDHSHTYKFLFREMLTPAGRPFLRQRELCDQPQRDTTHDTGSPHRGSCREKHRDTRRALCPVCLACIWSRVGLGVSLLCVVSARERQRERRGETGESMHHSRARNLPQPTLTAHCVCVLSLYTTPSPYSYSIYPGVLLYIESVWSPRAPTPIESCPVGPG